MRFSPLFLPVVIALTLAACAHPITQRPAITDEDVAAERQLETDQAMKNPFPPIVEPVYVTKAMRTRLQTVVDRIGPQATKLCYDINGPHQARSGDPEDNTSCTYEVIIKGRTGFNAYADGYTVYITAPMLAAMTDDNQLAMIIAHEFAHDIMEHHKRKGSNASLGSVIGLLGDAAAGSRGLNSKGNFSRIGGARAQMSHSIEYEEEADYVGLYIMARANYPIDKVPPFWRSLSRFQSDALYIRTSHPTNPERFVAMTKTVAEIRAKQRAHEPLIPNLQKET